ncbi:MAG: DMT family transporter [Rhodobacteraceae bacterium]|nr:DMT family transporter [Paracoccaceae bacterium]
MSEPARGHLAMLLFSALVAGSFALGAQVANLVSPVAFTAVRFVLATALVGIAIMVRGRVTGSSLAAPWRYLVLGGIFALYFVLMFEGLKTASPVSTSAVFTLTPALSALFGWFLLRQRTTPRIALALALGAAGALWVIFRADPMAIVKLNIGHGEKIFFLGSIAHAFYTPLVRRLNRGESALVFSFWTMVAGSALLWAYGWAEIAATAWREMPAVVWVTLGYTAFFASAVTFVLLQYATLRLPASKVMAYTYLTPSWVVVWQLFLGQPVPSLLVCSGIGLTVTALLLLLKDGDAMPARTPAK